ncbi:hypothetical protein EDB80DRAFT_826483, partial [Ilyonectria destructans]
MPDGASYDTFPKPDYLQDATAHIIDSTKATEGLVLRSAPVNKGREPRERSFARASTASTVVDPPILSTSHVSLATIPLEAESQPADSGFHSNDDESTPPPISTDIEATDLLPSDSGRSLPPAKGPKLFTRYEDVTKEACEGFKLMLECTYLTTALGRAVEPVQDCYCKKYKRNCGEDSGCLNRITKIECSTAGNCVRQCLNQRFQKRKYANVSVIKTNKKGFGIRADQVLKLGDFVLEYVGEVIDELTRGQRMVQYHEESIQHFFFMSLKNGEFIDGTKKANISRFCNHSCYPNCYVDQWVVGDKVRMGIFAMRKIQAGEELTFDYNMDSNQPCYCGEKSCRGSLSGKLK